MDDTLKPGGITYLSDDKFAAALRDPLLVERGKTHGSFAMNADISQHLKNVFRTLGNHYDMINNPQREALDMIALKLSRILSGRADHRDHWDDIAGYAKLGAEACDG